MDQEKKGCSLVKMKSNWEEKGFVSFISLLVLQHAQKSFLKFFLSIWYEKKIRFCFVLLFIIVIFFFWLNMLITFFQLVLTHGAFRDSG